MDVAFLYLFLVLPQYRKQWLSMKIAPKFKFPAPFPGINIFEMEKKLVIFWMSL